MAVHPNDVNVGRGYGKKCQAHDVIADAVSILAGGLADVGDDSENFAAGGKREGDLVHANVAAEETISE